MRRCKRCRRLRKLRGINYIACNTKYIKYVRLHPGPSDVEGRQSGVGGGGKRWCVERYQYKRKVLGFFYDSEEIPRKDFVTC